MVEWAEVRLASPALGRGCARGDELESGFGFVVLLGHCRVPRRTREEKKVLGACAYSLCPHGSRSGHGGTRLHQARVVLPSV